MSIDRGRNMTGDSAWFTCKESFHSSSVLFEPVSRIDGEGKSKSKSKHKVRQRQKLNIVVQHLACLSFSVNASSADVRLIDGVWMCDGGLNGAKVAHWVTQGACGYGGMITQHEASHGSTAGLAWRCEQAVP